MQENENHPKPGSIVKLILMSDIHMTNKPGRLAFPLRKFCDCDALLLTGDLVNDGLSEQYARVKQVLEQNKGYPLFAVAGNHDYPAEPEQDGDSWDWSAFQEWFLVRDRDSGMAATQHESGSYAVRMGPLEIIGLNCTAGYHKFGFAGTDALRKPAGKQRTTGRITRIPRGGNRIMDNRKLYLQLRKKENTRFVQNARIVEWVSDNVDAEGGRKICRTPNQSIHRAEGKTLHIKQRFPCFDSDDYLLEDRYYHWIYIVHNNALFCVHYDDENKKVEITRDVALIPDK